jgi:hypothetical protein
MTEPCLQESVILPDCAPQKKPTRPATRTGWHPRDQSRPALDETLTLADHPWVSRRPWPMPKPRVHLRHIGRTFYLSEWWDE